MGAGFIFANALASGVIYGIWTWGSSYLTMAGVTTLFLAWVGFVGGTSYFLAGAGKKGFIYSLISNYVGVLVGWTIIYLYVTVSPTAWFNGLCTGFFTAVLCYVAHFDILKFVPCTFLGGIAAFATGGDWKVLLVSLLVGNILGALSDFTTKWLYQHFTHVGKEDQADWVSLNFLKEKEGELSDV